MPSTRAPATGSFGRLLHRPRYPGFVLTVSLARTTGAMFNPVLLVLARTGSASLAGLTAAATVVPGALTGPVLGAWLTVTGFGGVALAAGAALGGVLHDPLTLICMLVAINLLAEALALDLG